MRGSAPSIRSLLLAVAAVMLVLRLVPMSGPAHAAAQEPQASLADCHKPAPAPRPDKPRSAETGCLSGCAIPAKEQPRATAPVASRHIPVPGCQLALRGIAPSPETPPPRLG